MHASPVRVLAAASLVSVCFVADPVFAAGVPCEAIAASLVAPNATVTLAQVVAPGSFTAPGRGGNAAAFASLPEIPLNDANTPDEPLELAALSNADVPP